MDHILATVKLSDAVDQPKVAGVSSGYSPHHKFPNINWLASGKHTYDDSILHYPGETLKAKISFASLEYMVGDVKVGDCFEIRENNRVIGFGGVDGFV